MKIVALTEYEYYNDKLLEEVKDVLLSFSTEKDMFFTFFEASTGNYGYMISKVNTEGSNSYSEVLKWKEDGDLEDAIEVFHNIHKSVYGFRPRYGTDEDWKDINWIRAETKAAVDAGRSYAMEEKGKYE